MRRQLGYAPLTIRYTTAGWIAVDERDMIPQRILARGFYEPEVWEALRPFVEEAEVVWDVGAHMGSFAIQALQNPRVKEVHVFEPDPLQYEALRENLGLNRGLYALHPIALGQRQESRALYRGPSINTGASSLICTENREVCHVQCETTDEMVLCKGLAVPTLMKVDVEGWEGQVLQGAKRLLTEQPPKAIAIEVPYLGEETFPPEIQELEKFGYLTRRIPRWSGDVYPRENYLAVHPSCA